MMCLANILLYMNDCLYDSLHCPADCAGDIAEYMHFWCHKQPHCRTTAVGRDIESFLLGSECRQEFCVQFAHNILEWL